MLQITLEESNLVSGSLTMLFTISYLRMKLSGILCTCSLVPKLSPQGEPGNEANIHAVLNPCRGYIVQGPGGRVHGFPQ